MDINDYEAILQEEAQLQEEIYLQEMESMSPAAVEVVKEPVVASSAVRAVPVKKEKERQMTPAELALLMQKERSAIVIESTSSALPATSVESEMHIMKTYRRVRVEKTSPSDISTFCPCIVNGGQVFPLKRRTAVESNISYQSTQLLSMPMKDLLVEADELKLRSTLTSTSSKLDQEHPVAYGRGGMMDLWVDKYAPHSFPQLLSNEKINREVLKSLKQWDKFVFKTSAATVAPAPSDISAASEGETTDSRPEKKVILLCGPPGTGKTTLAHIAASHCGYRVLEVNASDDRSPEALTDILHRGTQNQSLDADKRPNCIILDEIDGIDGKDTLKFLVNILKTPLRNTTSEKDKKGNKQQQQQGKAFPLTRPLICICNDQYAPALRELRLVAEIFVFTSPNELRLVQRLRNVCQSENLLVQNSSALNELCSATGQDIRSALNTLQFAALKSVKDSEGGGAATGAAGGAVDVSQALTKMISSGLKDDHMDVFQVLKSVFTRTITAPAAAAAAAAAESTKKPQRPQQQSCMEAMHAMSEFGDLRLLVNGIYENIHSMPATSLLGAAVDAGLTRCSLMLEWLSIADDWSAFAFEHADGFQVLNYVSLVGAAANHHSGVKPFRIAFPTLDRDMRYKREQKNNILSTLQEYARGKSLHGTVATQTRTNLAVDVLSGLLDLVAPRIRPLPMPSLTDIERLILADTCSVMELNGLSFVKTNRPTGFNFPSAGAGGAGGRFNNGSSGAGGYNNKPFGNQQQRGGGGYGGGYGSYSSIEAWELQPAINELVNYGENAQQAAALTAEKDAALSAAYGGVAGEMMSRRPPMVPDLAKIIHFEQKAFAIKLQVEKIKANEETTMQVVDQAADTPIAADPAVKAEVKSEPAAAAVAAAAAAAPVVTATSKILARGPQLPPEALNESNKRQKSSAVSSFFTSSKPSATTQVKSEVSSDVSVDKKRKASAIHFKFNQGFSNAVRRSVSIKDFL